jgi:hypothetical protein
MGDSKEKPARLGILPLQAAGQLFELAKAAFELGLEVVVLLGTTSLETAFNCASYSLSAAWPFLDVMRFLNAFK